MTQKNNAWEIFIKLCLSAKTPEALSKILSVLLTAEEKEDVSTRYLIMKELLAQEKTQRGIAKDLKVSIAKITRGSNELKRLDIKTLNHLKKYFFYTARH
jgi:TrpR family transcriptional regulator, trp operon repressor